MALIQIDHDSDKVGVNLPLNLILPDDLTHDGKPLEERKVLYLVELAYGGGVTDYLNVLDAQRSLFGAELDEIQAMNDQISALIQLYKALGGGWPVSAAEMATTN